MAVTTLRVARPIRATSALPFSRPDTLSVALKLSLYNKDKRRPQTVSQSEKK